MLADFKLMFKCLHLRII